MAEDKRKTETLTIRVDPQTKFMVEFLARFHGQSMTTVVERALAEAANGTFASKDGTQKGWSDFWYESEAARELVMAGEEKLHPAYSHRMRRQFAVQFWPFFFKDESCSEVNEAYAQVLYPIIDEFKYLFEERHDYNRATLAMVKYLEVAGLKPPEKFTRMLTNTSTFAAVDRFTEELTGIIDPFSGALRQTPKSED